MSDTDKANFAGAKNHLNDIMNGKTTLPIKAWKKEYADLTTKREILNQRYVALKDEMKEAEQIRKSVHSILWLEQGEQQPRRAQDMEL